MIFVILFAKYYTYVACYHFVYLFPNFWIIFDLIKYLCLHVYDYFLHLMKYTVDGHPLTSSFCAVEHHNLVLPFCPPCPQWNHLKALSFPQHDVYTFSNMWCWTCPAIDIGLYKKERTPLYLVPHLLEQRISILFRKNIINWITHLHNCPLCFISMQTVFEHGEDRILWQGLKIYPSLMCLLTENTKSLFFVITLWLWI